jgi:protein-disulfide isomerase
MRLHVTCRATLLGLLLTGCGQAPGEDAGVRPAGASPDHPSVERAYRGSARTFPLAGAGFARGDEHAPITVYEISDFGCRFCGVFAREELPTLQEEFIFPGRVRWVFIPTEGASPNGAHAARAAICAGEQGHFWEMHDRLFGDQRSWMRARDPGAVLTALATEAGVDPVEFGGCYTDAAVRSRLQRSSRLSLLLGVRATPSFFIDGRLIEGALRSREFSDLIRRVEGSRAGAQEEAT